MSDKKVLYVGHEAAPGWLEAHYIEKGVKIKEASSNEEAVRLMENNPYLSLILWDLDMGVDSLIASRQRGIDSLVLLNGESPELIEEATGIATVYHYKADKRKLYDPELLGGEDVDMETHIKTGKEIYALFSKLDQILPQ